MIIREGMKAVARIPFSGNPAMSLLAEEIADFAGEQFEGEIKQTAVEKGVEHGIHATTWAGAPYLIPVLYAGFAVTKTYRYARRSWKMGRIGVYAAKKTIEHMKDRKDD